VDERAQSGLHLAERKRVSCAMSLVYIFCRRHHGPDFVNIIVCILFVRSVNHSKDGGGANGNVRHFHHQYQQPQQKQQQQQHPPSQPLNNQRPIVHHSHPPAIHQMHSPNGNAYQYHPPRQTRHMTSPRAEPTLVNDFPAQAFDPNSNSPGGQMIPGGGRQPLYANAPPKPRRMTSASGGGGSRDPSPEPEARDMSYYRQHVEQQQQQLVRQQQWHPPAQQATRVQNLQTYQQGTPTPTPTGAPIRSAAHQHPPPPPPSTQLGPQMHHVPNQARAPPLASNGRQWQQRHPDIGRFPEHGGEGGGPPQQYYPPQQENQPHMTSPVKRGVTPTRGPPRPRGYPPPPVPVDAQPYHMLQQQQPVSSAYYHHQHHPQMYSSPQPQQPPYTSDHQRLAYPPPHAPQWRGYPQWPDYAGNNIHMPTQPQRAPRPKSADFLTAEANMMAEAAGLAAGGNVDASTAPPLASTSRSGGPARRRVAQQPQRPKSSIDSRMLSDDWWSRSEAQPTAATTTQSRKDSFVTEQISYYNNNQQQQRQKQRAAEQTGRSREQVSPIKDQQKFYPPPHVNSANDSSTLDSNDEVSQYFPTPASRMGPPPRQPYLNLPENSAAVMRQRPETATPGRSTRINGGGFERDSSAGGGGSDGGSSLLGGAGEFRRSASARLHRGRKAAQAALLDGGGEVDDGRRREQVM
jgi:hypothetical protein